MEATTGLPLCSPNIGRSQIESRRRKHCDEVSCRCEANAAPPATHEKPQSQPADARDRAGRRPKTVSLAPVTTRPPGRHASNDARLVLVRMLSLSRGPPLATNLCQPLCTCVPPGEGGWTRLPLPQLRLTDFVLHPTLPSFTHDADMYLCTPVSRRE